MNDWSHFGTDPEAVACTNGLGNDLCEPEGEDCQSFVGSIHALGTYSTMSTVLTTTPWKPPPRTGSAMTGSVSLTIMFDKSRVTRRRWPFFRMGLIFSA